MKSVYLIVFTALLGLGGQAFADPVSCIVPLAKISATCRIYGEDLNYLKSIANFCSEGKSDTGLTVVQAILNKKSGNALIVDTTGVGLCKFTTFEFNSLKHSKIEYTQAVDGKKRGDKIFFRAEDGGLFVMNMRHQIYEVRDVQGKKLHASTIRSPNESEKARRYWPAGKQYDPKMTEPGHSPKFDEVVLPADEVLFVYSKEGGEYFEAKYADNFTKKHWFEMLTFKELDQRSKTELTDQDLKITKGLNIISVRNAYSSYTNGLMFIRN